MAQTPDDSISGAQVVVWGGDPNQVDTVAEVDAQLQAMPGNGAGGRLFVGGAAGGHVGVYYDPDPATRGDASLVATIDSLSDPKLLTVEDFHLSSSGAWDY